MYIYITKIRRKIARHENTSETLLSGNTCRPNTLVTKSASRQQSTNNSSHSLRPKWVRKSQRRAEKECICRGNQWTSHEKARCCPRTCFQNTRNSNKRVFPSVTLSRAVRTEKRQTCCDGRFVMFFLTVFFMLRRAHNLVLISTTCAPAVMRIENRDLCFS